MPFMLQITAAVRRGAPQAFVMADMPFGSYQCGDDQAVDNAMRFLVEGQADAVKLEVGLPGAPLVLRLADAGVPVVAHIGSRPQHVRARGGYGPVGLTDEDADELEQTARAMVQCGAAMVLIEAVPAEVSQRLIEAIADEALAIAAGTVPVIGCGAGPACHGHVVVLHDLLGLSHWQPPFARPMVDLGQQISDVAEKWVSLVASGAYLRNDHPYTMTAPPPEKSPESPLEDDRDG